MSFDEQKWQTTRPKIKERNKFMFNNDLLSDVKFVVRESNGESKKSKKVIPAHKFVLSISSPVFFAMFYGDLADTRDSIDLPDCEYEALLELFRYMYSDEVKLSGNNVMQVLYLAKKYIVPSLAEKCSEYLQKKLNGSNVFSVLPTAQTYEEKNLLDRCWEVIDLQPEKSVKSEDFVTIERSLLEEVVERKLNMKEVELFKAVNHWAIKECERLGLERDGKVKRSILGERIVKGIRFTMMNQEEFAGVVVDSKILTPEEVVDISKDVSTVDTSSVGINSSNRNRDFEQIGRFMLTGSVDSGWDYTGKPDCIILSIDKDILLHGVTLFGSENNRYSVVFRIKNMTRGLEIASKSGIFSSVYVESKRGNYYGFDILFDPSVVLQKGMKYCFKATITGPPSGYGFSGFSSVECQSGVTFYFQSVSQYSYSCTRLDKGQFPKFMFSLK